MRSGRPVVGIVAGRHQVPRFWGTLPVQGVTEWTPGPLAAAGALPQVLPLLPQDALPADSYLAQLDALVLAGGGDLDPAAYGDRPHPSTTDVDRLRDGTEIALAGPRSRCPATPYSACSGTPELQPGATQKALFDWLVRSAGP